MLVGYWSAQNLNPCAYFTVFLKTWYLECYIQGFLYWRRLGLKKKMWHSIISHLLEIHNKHVKGSEKFCIEETCLILVLKHTGKIVAELCCLYNGLGLLSISSIQSSTKIRQNKLTTKEFTSIWTSGNIVFHFNAWNKMCVCGVGCVCACARTCMWISNDLVQISRGKC
jgi:hypothetical protein